MGYKLTDEDDILIKDLYVNQKKSSTEIGELLGVSHGTVLRHLKNMNIQRRSLSESQFIYNKKEIPEEFSDRETMYDLYINKHMTKEQLGKRFNCAPHVIDRILKEYNIPIRGASEAKIGVQRGDSHHNWKGGVTSLYARCREFSQKNIAPLIKERDDYTCCECGSKQNLQVHHNRSFIEILNEIVSEHPEYDPINDVNILYEIVVNDDRFLDNENLITVCKSCHQYKIHGYNKTIRSEA